MTYVKTLLQRELNHQRAAHDRFKVFSEDEDTRYCLVIISELEYVLSLLDKDETYQNY